MPRPEVENTASVDPAEIRRFEAMADEWWDPTGKFKPLHRMNPVRLAYIRDRAREHFDFDAESLTPFEGLSLVDIGCGGGLLCEPMARLGADVVGVDASERNVQMARLHAESSGLAIDYRHATAEALAAAGERFDIVLNMEVVEHVADVDGFLEAAVELLKPDGLMIVATLNRTLKSYALGIVAAEYVMRWLPRGTHDWRRFLRPSEMAAVLRGAGAEVCDVTGVSYNPLSDKWGTGRDLDVNYMLSATHADSAP